MPEVCEAVCSGPPPFPGSQTSFFGRVANAPVVSSIPRIRDPALLLRDRHLPKSPEEAPRAARQTISHSRRTADLKVLAGEPDARSHRTLHRELGSPRYARKALLNGIPTSESSPRLRGYDGRPLNCAGDTMGRRYRSANAPAWTQHPRHEASYVFLGAEPRVPRLFGAKMPVNDLDRPASCFESDQHVVLRQSSPAEHAYGRLPSSSPRQALQEQLFIGSQTDHRSNARCFNCAAVKYQGLQETQPEIRSLRYTPMELQESDRPAGTTDGAKPGHLALDSRDAYASNAEPKRSLPPLIISLSPSHSGDATPVRSPLSASSITGMTRKLFSVVARSTSELSSRSSSSLRAIMGSRRAVAGSQRSSPLQIEDEQWPEPLQGKRPSSRIQAAICRLAPNVQLVDIDASLRARALDGKHVALVDLHKLTTYERHEIQSFKRVYYYGSTRAQKPAGGFCDSRGNYNYAVNDHIGYRYQVLGQLGEGSFGRVLQCRDHKTGRLVAVKVTANRAELCRQARVEAALLEQLRQKGSPDRYHFLRHIEHFVFRDHMCIATELLGPNLYELLRRNKFKGLDGQIVRHLTRQIVVCLEFLERAGVIHCDLKPENILISGTEYCQVKVIDFGSSCYHNKRVYTYIQSRFYRAPEVLLGTPYSGRIDLWSLGCIVPELIRGRPLFPGDDEADQVASICEVLGLPSETVLRKCSRAGAYFDQSGKLLRRARTVGRARIPGSRPLRSLLPADAAQFCSTLLQWSPDKRPSAMDTLFHEYLLHA